MNKCRICLKGDAVKYLNDLESKKFNKTFSEVLSFCLDIHVTKEEKHSKKLCYQCHRKILTFFKFKTLAQQNDVYFRSRDSNDAVENKIFIKDNIQSELNISEAQLQIVENVGIEVDIKEELEDPKDNDDEYVVDDDDENVVDDDVDDDDGDEDYVPEDNELLSVIKNIKYGYIKEEPQEVNNAKSCNKISRKKKSKKGNWEVCDECGKRVKKLKQHLLQHRPCEERRTFKCTLCDKTFLSTNARGRHVKYKHLGLKNHCEICNKAVVNVRSHKLMVHDRSSLSIACPWCGLRCITRSALEIHLVTHTKDRPFSCEFCDKTFKTRSTLSTHKRTVHDKEKQHLCQFCSKSFFKKYHLQNHLRIHTKERPYSCEKCGKDFLTTSARNIHLLIHDNTKSYACKLCDMTFALRRYLDNHMKSHIKDKRYVCRHCGMGFHRSDHRHRHEVVAHRALLTNLAQP